jgi:hypothetical protein
MTEWLPSSSLLMDAVCNWLPFAVFACLALKYMLDIDWCLAMVRDRIAVAVLRHTNFFHVEARPCGFDTQGLCHSVRAIVV